MGTKRQTGQEYRANGWRSMLASGAIGLSVTIATGCSSTATTAQQGTDPLFGIKPPPGAVAPPANPTAVVAPAPAPVGVAAVPTSSASRNTATLAGSNYQTPFGQPYPINDPNAQAPFLPGQATTANAQLPPGALPPNPSPKMEPVPDAAPSAPPTAAPITNWQPPQGTQPIVQTASVAPAPDYARQLRDRGVQNQKVEQMPDGVRLTCYVSRGTTGVTIHEVTRTDYATAAQAMLRELDPQR